MNVRLDASPAIGSEGLAEGRRAVENGDRRLILGHPRGLLVLAGTELWDRISFSGMQAILVLYMVERLFLPDHIGRIAGFSAFRRIIELATGPLMSQALASQVFGLYVGLIYLTPILGGLIGDRVLGRRRSVALGALLMTAGHFCMAFEASFLAALLLLIVGAGFLRGNLAPQVAELYAPDDHRRSVAFQIYFSMVSLGAFVAPLATGALSQVYGWDIAFAFAGFGMLVGLVVYLVGQPMLPSVGRRAVSGPRAKLQPGERRILFGLLSILPPAALFWVAQAQVWNTYNLWVRDHVDLRIGSFIVPVPWLQSLDGLAPLATLPVILVLWRWQERRGSAPDELARMAMGLLIFAASVALLAMASSLPNSDGKVLLAVPVAFHLASNVGWLYFAPSANSLVAGVAPPSMRGTMIGIYTSSMFFGSVISGRLGGLYERLSPENFWWLHAFLAGGGGMALLLVGGRVRRMIGSPSKTARPA